MKPIYRYILIAAAVLAFTAEVFSRSSEHQYPKWDEVSYIALARDYARLGGVTDTLGCYLEERCQESNRHPLYLLLLQLGASDGPEFYPLAKLLTYGSTLILLLIVFLWVRSVQGEEVAAVTVVLLCLMPALTGHSARVLCDVLYAAFFYISVQAIAHWQKRGSHWWLLAGAFIGLAYLTKGSGYLLFLPLIVTGLVAHRGRFFLRPAFYVAIIGFIAVAWFLLWRNASLFDNPFYNFNNRVIWMDGWEELWTLSRSGEWKDVGLLWYLGHHTVFDLLWRLLKGLGISLGVLVYTAGIGVDQTVLRALTGLLMLVLAGWSMVRRYRAGHHLEIVAILAATGFSLMAFSVGSDGVGGTPPRFVLPLVVLYVPYAGAFLVRNFLPWIVKRLEGQGRVAVTVAVLLILVVKLVLHGGALFENPMKRFKVPAIWGETSLWLKTRLKPGERFALNSHSYYSTWDQPFPDSDARWNYQFKTTKKRMLKHLKQDGIRKILIDTADQDFPDYKMKLSIIHDAKGPLHFLGWPRCFADSGRPSRFLIYCRPSGD